MQVPSASIDVFRGGNDPFTHAGESIELSRSATSAGVHSVLWGERNPENGSKHLSGAVARVSDAGPPDTTRISNFAAVGGARKCHRAPLRAPTNDVKNHGWNTSSGHLKPSKMEKGRETHITGRNLQARSGPCDETMAGRRRGDWASVNDTPNVAPRRAALHVEKRIRVSFRFVRAQPVSDRKVYHPEHSRLPPPSPLPTPVSPLAVVTLLTLGSCGFPPSSRFGGAASVGVAFPFLFGVVLFSFLGWCCGVFVPCGWCSSLSLLSLGVACFVSFFGWWCCFFLLLFGRAASTSLGLCCRCRVWN